MCFSATASFTVAGVLVPVAAYSLRAAWRGDRRWLGMAAFPAAFGVQQAIEGGVWVGLASGNAELVALAARGFLFFSHFFWLAWVPFATRLIEPAGPRRTMMGWLAVLGGAFGLTIMLPAVIIEGWLTVAVTDGSIDYRTLLVHERWTGQTLPRVAYAVVILGALFLSSWWSIRLFGALILVSVLGTALTASGVFISVWCFFAAVLSVYIAGMFASRGRVGTAL